MVSGAHCFGLQRRPGPLVRLSNWPASPAKTPHLLLAQAKCFHPARSRTACLCTVRAAEWSSSLPGPRTYCMIHDKTMTGEEAHQQCQPQWARLAGARAQLKTLSKPSSNMLRLSCSNTQLCKLSASHAKIGASLLQSAGILASVGVWECPACRNMNGMLIHKLKPLTAPNKQEFMH